MGFGDKFQQRLAEGFGSAAQALFKAGRGPLDGIHLDAGPAAQLAKDVYANFKDKGVVASSTYANGFGFGVRVDLKATPDADKVAAEVNAFIAKRTEGAATIRVDWQSVAKELVAPLREALGSQVSRIEVTSDGHLMIEASTEAKDLEKIRQQAEAVVRNPNILVHVAPFSSAVTFNANTFRDHD